MYKKPIVVQITVVKFGPVTELMIVIPGGNESGQHGV